MLNAPMPIALILEIYDPTYNPAFCDTLHL
jgi:hypothetical protein